ncbi:MAG: LacI family DNA-binding transcriptional regulator [Anaerolineae bacterium]|nr:LacI family DNA-binding transcriptional regulator [Anaerolineae bacterium]
MPTRKQKRPTMRDVAENVGVSIQTISAVINNKPEITLQTRQRVMDAIHQLGYRPDRTARSLRTGQSHTLALIVSDIANPSFATIASTAEDCAQTNGYYLTVHNTHDDPVREEKYVQAAAERGLDGVILVSAEDRMDSSIVLENAQIPFVAIDRIPEGYTGLSVTLDNVKAGQLAARHLLGLGHTRLAHISGPLRLRLARERLSGFETVLQEKGLSLKPEWVCESNWYCEEGYLAMKKMLQSSPLPTAVFAANDRMAIGAIQAIYEVGLRVPEDISVIGLDDIEVSAYHIPALTTIRQPFANLATQAIQILLDVIQGNQPEVAANLIEPFLIQRASTAPPANQAKHK